MNENSPDLVAQSSTTTPAVPAKPPGPTFAEMGLRPELLRALADMGFTEPMDVQAKTLPLVRAGRDIMVQSRTGSGKTAAFGIPLIDKVVSPEEKFVQAIILLPTRELALQVASELARVGAHSGVAVVPVYGGAPMGRQIEQLRAGGQIVCGTPGRVLDHLRRGTLQLEKVKCAVLDECDEMLSMGFQEDIEAILEHTPAERQTLLFSATVPEGIQRLSRRFMRNPEMVKLSADFIGVHEIRHVYYSIPGGQRENELLRILAFENPQRAIVFCNTREETGRVAEFLRKSGFDAEAISSDLSQTDRERVMTRMRAGGIQFLVATDVAARGIDLENLSHVFNFTFPDSPEVYIHRTGRTGRAGKHGTAISLIGPTEVGAFYYVKLLYKIRPEERSLPSEVEIRSKREGERILALRAALTTDAGAEWRSLARRLMGSSDAERLIGAMLAQQLAAPVRAPDATEPRRISNTSSGSSSRPSSSSRPTRDRARPPRQAESARFTPPVTPPVAAPAAAPIGAPTVATEAPVPRQPPAPAARPASPPAATRAGQEFWEVWHDETLAAAETPPVVSARPPAPERRPPAPRSDELREGPAPGQVRLFLSLGRKDGASVDEVVALLGQFGAVVTPAQVDLMSTHSYINIASSDAERVCPALHGAERGGRRLICEPARPRR